MKVLFISIFGVLGVLSRYGAALFFSKYSPPPFPLGTFFINVTGSFLIGVVYALGVERSILNADLRSGLMVGFLGGYTTFSSYALETLILWNEKKSVLALLYFGASPVLGLLAAGGGVWVARGVLSLL